MKSDKAVCVCVCHRDTMTLSVSHCAFSWCRYAWLVSLSLSLSLSLSAGWLGPLSAALKALMSSWGEISACIISKPHCLHKNHVAYIFPALFFSFIFTFFFLHCPWGISYHESDLVHVILGYTWWQSSSCHIYFSCKLLKSYNQTKNIHNWTETLKCRITNTKMEPKMNPHSTLPT